MNDHPLERRCRRVVRAYPPGPRADEVLATLIESNEGRDRPRLADAANVLWHGVAARVRNPPAGTHYGEWGDAAAVSVMILTWMQAIAAWAFHAEVTSPRDVPHPSAPWLGSVAFVAALIASLTAVAAMRGKVRQAQVGVAATALAAITTVLSARAMDRHDLVPGSWGVFAALAPVGVALAVLLTSSVTRAAAVWPFRWKRLALILPLSAGSGGENLDVPFGSGAVGVALLACTALAWFLLVIALRGASFHCSTFGGIVLLAAATAPWAVASNAEGQTPLFMAAVVVAVWVGLGALLTWVLWSASSLVDD